MYFRSDGAGSSDLLGLLVEDDTVVLGLEPLHGVLLVQAVGGANLAGLGERVSLEHKSDTGKSESLYLQTC